jgi:hypothetical protein
MGDGCLSGAWVSCKGVHKDVDTPWVSPRPRDEPFQARAIGLCLVDHHPIRSRGGYSNGPGLNASFRFGCPRFPRLAPGFSYVY